MGWSEKKEKGSRCRKHPKHQLSIGVCPFCLRDKLSRLSATPAAAISSVACLYSSTASSSPCSLDSELSSPCSGASTPEKVPRRSLLLIKGHHHHHHHHHTKPAESIFTGASFRKSRSLVFVHRRQRKEEEEEQTEMNNSKGNRKFWSKWLNNSRRINKEGESSLMHSKTLKEKPSTKWILFA